MARILIAEPYAEVQQLFVHFVSALGHEAVVHDPAVTPVGIDAVILEPAMHGAAELVESLRALDADLPVIAVSVYPPSALPVRIDWTSFHLKPFGLTVLRDALATHVPSVTAAA
jgi:CheY-like chemotaxis protein